MNETTNRIEPIDARRAADGKWRDKMRAEVRQEIDVALGYALAFAYTGIDPLLLMLAGGPGLARAIDRHELGRDGPFLAYAKPLVENAVRTWLRGPENQQDITRHPPPSLPPPHLQEEPNDDRPSPASR